MELIDIILIALEGVWDEVAYSMGGTGFAFLSILAYRKSPWRKKRIAEKMAREEKQWRETTDQRLRDSGLGA